MAPKADQQTLQWYLEQTVTLSDKVQAILEENRSSLNNVPFRLILAIQGDALSSARKSVNEAWAAAEELKTQGTAPSVPSQGLLFAMKNASGETGQESKPKGKRGSGRKAKAPGKESGPETEKQDKGESSLALGSELEIPGLCVE